MSELPDGSGQIRRSPRISEGGAPVSGALAIVLAVIAVLAGFFILRSISDGGEQEFGAPISDESPGSVDTDTNPAGDDVTDVDPSATTVPFTVAPATTAPPFQTQGAEVIVANANSQGGSAGAMTRALEVGPGFLMVEPVNANESIGDIATSVIYFDTTNPTAQGVAESLAIALGGVESVTPLPDSPVVSGGTLNGATVVLMLGEDKANRTLDELNPETSGSVAVVTNPTIAPEG